MDIASLLDSLSDEDLEKLKDTANRFFGSPVEEKKKEALSGEKFAFDPKMLTSVAKISSLMNENDPRSDFLIALKPLLSESRRQKADEAAMMLKFFRILSMLEGSL